MTPDVTLHNNPYLTPYPTESTGTCDPTLNVNFNLELTWKTFPESVGGTCPDPLTLSPDLILYRHRQPHLAQDPLPRHCAGLADLTLFSLHGSDPLQEALPITVLDFAESFP